MRPPSLRSQIVLLYLGLLSFWLQPAAAQIEVISTTQQLSSDDWRHTSHGWEHLADIRWSTEASRLPAITGVHPMLICSLEVLLCLGAFCLFPSSPSAERRSAQ